MIVLRGGMRRVDGSQMMTQSIGRDQFPVTQNWVFLDHAAVAPLSLPAQTALVEWADDAARNGSVHLTRWTARVRQVREAAARLIGAGLDEIAFVKNTSEGICFVAEGFPWNPGDNVVTAAEEYPSNLYPWINLKHRGVELRRVATRERRIWPEDLLAATDSRTRLVAISFVEYASGYRNDLEAIGTACRQRGICFLVDAIQGLGVLPLSVQAWPVDFLSADGHKWLLGPEGAGIFYIRKELIDFLHPISVGWKSVVGAIDFSTIDFRLKASAGRWESGSLNVGGIVSMGASIDLLLKAGIDHVAERVLGLTDYLCDRLRQEKFDVYSSRRSQDRSGIVSIAIPAQAMDACLRACRDDAIIIAQRAGRLRVSPHFYNSDEEMDRLVRALVRARSS